MESPDHTPGFAEELHAATPVVWVTPLLIAANVAVFGLMILDGVGWMEPTIAQLLDWGANYRPKTAAGDWWRLLTSTFVHIGVVHLLFNMVVFAQAGPLLERLLGNVGFLILYVLSGLGGSLLSAFWHADIVSAGASGAVFGVYGALLGIWAFHSGQIPKEVLAGVGKGALVFVGFNLLYSFRPGVDMAGHLGGLAAGALLAVVLPDALGRTRGAMARRLGTALVGAGLIAGGWVALPDTPDSQGVLQDVSAVEDRVITAWNAAVQRAQSGTVSDPELARIIEEDLLPDWSGATTRVQELVTAGASNPRLGDLLEYMQARQTGWQVIVEGLRQSDTARVEEGMTHQNRAEEILARMNQH